MSESETERKSEVLPPLEMSPSSIATNPAESREAPPTPQYPSTLRDTLGSSLRSPAEVEGNDFFPPQPEKDLESPSSTRLEALVPSHYSRATTRSSSLREGRPQPPIASFIALNSRRGSPSPTQVTPPKLCGCISQETKPKRT